MSLTRSVGLDKAKEERERSIGLRMDDAILLSARLNLPPVLIRRLAYPSFHPNIDNFQSQMSSNFLDLNLESGTRSTSCHLFLNNFVGIPLSLSTSCHYPSFEGLGHRTLKGRSSIFALPSKKVLRPSLSP